jgi:hypothetical protein
MNDNIILIAPCNSVEHQIVFRYIKDINGESTIYASIYLWKHGFIRRLVAGIKYIFGYKCRYGQWEEFIFTKEHLNMLTEFFEHKEREE